MFSGDPKNKPTCIDNATLPDCLKEWPPLLTSGAPSSGAGARQSLLGTAKRPNGLQVTYAGHPLYYFRGDGSTPADKKTGDVHGEGYVNEWWVLASNGKPVKWALPYSYTHPS
jgi:predicted lipoprotein with Yx(FWY)xxD motif